MKVGVGDRKRRGLKIVIRVLHHSGSSGSSRSLGSARRRERTLKQQSGKEKGTSCEATTAALAFLLEF